jgi:hypothetical protein
MLFMVWTLDLAFGGFTLCPARGSLIIFISYFQPMLPISSSSVGHTDIQNMDRSIVFPTRLIENGHMKVCPQGN